MKRMLMMIIITMVIIICISIFFYYVAFLIQKLFMSIHLKSITRGQVNDYIKPGTAANFDDLVFFFLYKLAFKLE